MGRVQNTFFFIGTFLQLLASLAVGAIAEHVSLVVAFGIIGILYAIAALTAASCRVKGQPL
jgi:succinate-acetate transporter protein